MLKEILIKEYTKLFKDVINEYSSILKKNDGYVKYLKIINYEIKTIINAFEILLSTKKDTFKSIFENDIESILYTVDKTLFGHIKDIFENVSTILNAK